MTGMTEETAIDLLDEIMTLNTNIKDLTSVIERLIDDVSPQGTTAEEVPENKDTDDDEDIPEETEKPEKPEVGEAKKKYNYFGPQQFDPKVPVPECFGRVYDTAECKAVKEQCSWKDLCAEIPSCFIKGYGLDDCLTKIEECAQGERCANLHADEIDYDPRTERLLEFGERVQDLKEQ